MGTLNLSTKHNSTRVALWIGLVLGMAGVTVWLRLWIVRTSYEIDLLDRQVRTRTLDEQKLQADVERLRSPSRLQAESVRFQLDRPKPHQIMILQKASPS